MRALALALTAPPLLEIFSLARLIPFLSSGSRVAEALDDQALASWVDRILDALPWPWRRTCLRRAVVLYALLHHAGRPVQLWIGVRNNRDAPDNEGVSAHAWLTSGGVPYLEANVDHVTAHTPIARFPEALAE
ncbi:MAG TPA: lasso peptide biosynthesis B2 protein [Gemmatimonadales bacterium]|nr:lasso peptide biosynthesis B2 protein [Gemmatimonadales bacterium]